MICCLDSDSCDMFDEQRKAGRAPTIDRHRHLCFTHGLVIRQMIWGVSFFLKEWHPKKLNGQCPNMVLAVSIKVRFKAKQKHNSKKFDFIWYPDVHSRSRQVVCIVHHRKDGSCIWPISWEGDRQLQVRKRTSEHCTWKQWKLPISLCVLKQNG